MFSNMRDLNWGSAFWSVLIIGLGQILKGEGKKGLVLILLFYFTAPMLLFLSLQLGDVIFLTVFSLVVVLEIGLWLYGVWDALKT
jgi:TM2 domain-containing membrane protein YozV